MPATSQPQPTQPLGTPTPGSAPVQPPSLRRPLPANYPPGFRPISRTGRSATLTYAPGAQEPAEASAQSNPLHDKQMAEVKRQNAMARNSEQMFAVVKRFKDLCNSGVIVSRTTQAECDRIIAAVEGGAS